MGLIIILFFIIVTLALVFKTHNYGKQKRYSKNFHGLLSIVSYIIGLVSILLFSIYLESDALSNLFSQLPDMIGETIAYLYVIGLMLCVLFIFAPIRGGKHER